MESSTHSTAPLPPGVRAAVAAATGDESAEPALAWLSWAGTAWRLAGPSGAVFAKRAADLSGERARLEWLMGRWPVPEVVGLFHESGDDWLVTRELPGTPLFHASHGMEPSEAARLLGDVLRGLHATNAAGFPFGARAPGRVLVHGDYCLPNVLVVAGRLSGIVDVGRAGLGRPDDDLAAGLWSLQYSFGRGFERDFLTAYGWPPMSDEAIERLRRRYSRRLR